MMKQQANIYFTFNPDSKEGFPKVEILKIVELQLVGILHKAKET